MPYCDIDDLIIELGALQLARLSGDPAGITVNNARVEAAITGAGELIDAYLRGRHALPPEGGEALLKGLAVDMTVFNLYVYESHVRIMPPQAAERKKEAIAMLIRLQSGKASLFGSGGVPGTPPLVLSNKRPEDRIFGRERLDAFRL